MAREHLHWQEEDGTYVAHGWEIPVRELRRRGVPTSRTWTMRIYPHLQDGSVHWFLSVDDYDQPFRDYFDEWFEFSDVQPGSYSLLALVRTAERFQYHVQERCRRSSNPLRYLLGVITGIHGLRHARFGSWVAAEYGERFQSKLFEGLLESAIIAQAKQEKEHEKEIESIFEMDE